MLPRYVRGPKPKRRTELGLLIYGALLTTGLYVIAELGAKSKIPPHIGPFLAILLGLALVTHMANRWLVPQGNAVILPLAVLLNGIGYVVIARWNPPYAKSQAGWAALGVLLYIGTLLIVRFSRDLERYRYLILLAGGILLVAPLFFSPIQGARLWIHFSSFSFQPIEFSKLLFCVYFASYFAANKEMLTIPTARLGNRLVLDPRPLIPIIVAWGGGHGGDRPGGRHRLRRPFVRALHRLALGGHRAGRLPRPRVHPVRRRGRPGRPLLRAGALPGRPVAQSLARRRPEPGPAGRHAVRDGHRRHRGHRPGGST